MIPPSSMGDLARNRKCTKMLTDRRTDGQTDRRTDGQTDPDPIVPRARATRRARGLIKAEMLIFIHNLHIY